MRKVKSFIASVLLFVLLVGMFIITSIISVAVWVEVHPFAGIAVGSFLMSILGLLILLALED